MSFSEQTYGELYDTQKMFSLLCEHISYPGGYRFYDFGSGYGKVVEEYSDKFESLYGVEINKERHIMSLINKKSDKVSLIFGNFFHTTIEGPCVVFCNNLCLGNGSLKRLSQKFNKELKPGDLLIVTKPMPLLREQYKVSHTVNCSWGDSEIYLYTF